MMEIILKRNVLVESYEAIMEIASFDEKYGFILPVLQLEEEGGITVEQVNTKLLNKKPDHPMGERLLDRVEQFRLITQEYRELMENQSSDVGIYHPTERGEKLMQLLRKGYFREIDDDLLILLKDLDVIFQKGWSGLYMITSTGNALVDGLWPLNSNQFEANLFKSLESYGLVENPKSEPRSERNDRCILTELGKKALLEGKLPIPEKGLFVLYTTDDPLFSENLIAYEPKHEKKGAKFKEIAFKRQNAEKMDNKDNRNSNKPQWLNQLIKSLKSSPKIIGLAAQNGEEIQLINIEGEVNRSGQNKTVSIALEISSNQNPKMEVITSAKDKKLTSLCKPNVEMTVTDLLKQLVPEHADDIIESNHSPALLIRFDEIKNNPSEVHSGIRKLKIKSPKIEGLGQFNDVTIEGVTLLPRSLEDAISWANYLVSDSIEYFIDENAYNTLCDKAVKRFSGRFDANEMRTGIRSFDEMKIELVDEKERNPQKYWYVTAPEILSFNGVR